MKANALKPIITTLILSSVLLLASCAGLNLNDTDDDSTDASSDTGQFTIGGTASGLDGSVLLVNNLTDAKSLSSAGAFTFGDALADGATYNVIVATNPLTQRVPFQMEPAQLRPQTLQTSMSRVAIQAIV
ncbi:MAG: hypothetical protein O3A01_06530 [bacterium]|nr:hypothetical protein [bacterium]